MTQITLPHNHGESADELFSLLPAPQEFQTSAELFGLLSDESRLRIFWILCHYEECGNQPVFPCWYEQSCCISSSKTIKNPTADCQPSEWKGILL